MKQTITLTNNLTGQEFTYYVVVSNKTQLYSRIRVLMIQLSNIEQVDLNNISHYSRLAA